MEGIVTTGCSMDFENYPYDKHRCKFLMGSTGFPDSLMAFNSTFTFSAGFQRPLQYEVKEYIIISLASSLFLVSKHHLI